MDISHGTTATISISRGSSDPKLAAKLSGPSLGSDVGLTVNVNFDDAVRSAYDEVRTLSYREVLMSNLEGKSYSGDLTDLISRDTVTAGLKQAYVKILCLLDYVATLKDVLNSFTSISRVPDEVLLQIFALCTHRHHDASLRSRRWLSFSQVCKRWRVLALSAPSLWTDLDYSTPRLAELMTERARSAPVSVSIPSHRLPSFFPRRSQMRALKFSDFLPPSSWAAGQTELKDYLYGKFPQLKTLKLMSMKAQSKTSYDLTGLDAPRLRNIVLHNWLMRDLNVPSMGGLTSLELVRTPGRANEYGPIFALSNILEVLRRSPGLVSLILRRVIGATGGESLRDEAGHGVGLPCLKRLELSDKVLNVTLLLSFLSLPEVQELIVCGDAACNVVAFSSTINHLLGAIRIHHATLTFQERYQSTLTISSESNREESTPRDRPCRLELSFIGDRDYEHIMALFWLFVSTSFLSSITSLNVLVYRHFVDAWTALQPFWEAAVGLSDLEAFELRGHDTASLLGDLLSALSGNPSPVHPTTIGETDPSHEISKAFPALKTITLQKLRLPEGSRAAETESLIALLVDVVNLRAEKGTPLIVDLVDCGLSEVRKEEFIMRKTEHVRFIDN